MTAFEISTAKVIKEDGKLLLVKFKDRRPGLLYMRNIVPIYNKCNYDFYEIADIAKQPFSLVEFALKIYEKAKFKEAFRFSKCKDDSVGVYVFCKHRDLLVIEEVNPLKKYFDERFKQQAKIS